MPLAMNREVFITCAVTGAIHTPSMSPHLPVTPDEVAAAAIGAAGAAATAAGQSVGGSSMHRQFVQQCLAERGYQVIGWH